MSPKTLLELVRKLVDLFPKKDEWGIYYRVRMENDSVTQRRVARAVKKLKKEKAKPGASSLPQPSGKGPPTWIDRTGEKYD